MHRTRKIKANILIDISDLHRIQDAIIETLERKYVMYTDKNTGATTTGRCVADSFNTGIELVHFGSPRNTEKPQALVSVVFNLQSVDFPKSYVLKNCVMVEYTASGLEYSDTGFYRFSLDTDNQALREQVMMMLESKYLSQSQKKVLSALKPGDKANLKIIGNSTFENCNKLICNCMYDEGFLPVFKLNMNFPLDAIGLSSISEKSYYTVEKGKVVETKKVKDDQIVSFLSNSDLLDFISFLKVASPAD